MLMFKRSFSIMDDSVIVATRSGLTEIANAYVPFISFFASLIFVLSVVSNISANIETGGK